MAFTVPERWTRGQRDDDDDDDDSGIIGFEIDAARESQHTQ